MNENDISVKDAFEMADEAENEDGEEEVDNSASYEEFKEMVANLVNDDGQEDLLTPEQIALIVAHVDSDNNGTINLEEFTGALTNKISPGTTLDVLMAQMASTWGEDDSNGAEYFELFDGDGSGTMSYEEFETNLIELFDSLNYNKMASEEEKQLAKNNIGRLQKHFDQNLDGQVHSAEFRAALQSKLVPPDHHHHDRGRGQQRRGARSQHGRHGSGAIQRGGDSATTGVGRGGHVVENRHAARSRETGRFDARHQWV